MSLMFSYFLNTFQVFCCRVFLMYFQSIGQSVSVKKKQKPKRFKYLRYARCKEQRLKWRPAAGYRCLGAEQGVNEKSQEMEFK